MKTNLLKDGALTENSVGIGPVTRKMVKDRAIQLAITDGRTAKEVSSADWQKAEQELSGQPEIDPKEALLESAPESERWDPVGGSTGGKVPVASGEDEDNEGRSDNERLVEEGMSEAELDLNVQATRDARKKDL